MTKILKRLNMHYSPKLLIICTQSPSSFLSTRRVRLLCCTVYLCVSVPNKKSLSIAREANAESRVCPVVFLEWDLIRYKESLYLFIYYSLLCRCHVKIVPGARIVPAYVIHSNPFHTCLATDDRIVRCLATGDRVEWRGRFLNIRELVHWVRQDR